MTIKKICVYCGSSPGVNPAYLHAATKLGQILCERNIGLVYGGAAVGVMGAVANAVLEGGGEVIGVIPESLAIKEVAHENLTEQHVVSSMHERKAMMENISDGFIALPGGWGTLEEIFEILTWGQLGFHHKPCGLLNIDGYFDHLIAFLENAFSQKFVSELYRPILMTAEEPTSLLSRFASYQAPKVRKWMSESEL